MNQNQTNDLQNSESNFNSNEAQIQKPTPVDREVQWNKKQTIVSKIDLFGNILSVNDAFEDVSGYLEHEIKGKSFDVLSHPEMPTVINKLLWENVKNEKRFFCIVKNLAKSGRYYWVLVDFEYVKESNGNVVSYIYRNKDISQSVIANHIQPLYRKLHLIEQASGLETSKQFLVGFLEDIGQSYVDYITKLIANDIQDDNEVEGSWWHL